MHDGDEILLYDARKDPSVSMNLCAYGGVLISPNKKFAAFIEWGVTGPYHNAVYFASVFDLKRRTKRQLFRSDEKQIHGIKWFDDGSLGVTYDYQNPRPGYVARLKP